MLLTYDHDRCTELRARIQQITDGEYATAKRDVDGLRAELGQPPLPGLQATLEEKSQQYAITSYNPHTMGATFVILLTMSFLGICKIVALASIRATSAQQTRHLARALRERVESGRVGDLRGAKTEQGRHQVAAARGPRLSRWRQHNYVDGTRRYD